MPIRVSALALLVAVGGVAGVAAQAKKPPGRLGGAPAQDLGELTARDKLLLRGPVRGKVEYRRFGEEKGLPLVFPEKLKLATGDMEYGRVQYVTETGVLIRGFNNEVRLFSGDEYATIELWVKTPDDKDLLFEWKPADKRFKVTGKIPELYAAVREAWAAKRPPLDADAFFARSLARMLIKADAAALSSDLGVLTRLEARTKAAAAYAEGQRLPADLVGTATTFRRYVGDLKGLRDKEGNVLIEYRQKQADLADVAAAKRAKSSAAALKPAMGLADDLLNPVGVVRTHYTDGTYEDRNYYDGLSILKNGLGLMAVMHEARQNEQQYRRALTDLDRDKAARLKALHDDRLSTARTFYAAFWPPVEKASGVSKSRQLALLVPPEDFTQSMLEKQTQQMLDELEAAAARSVDGTPVDPYSLIELGNLRVAVKHRTPERNYREWVHADKVYDWATRALAAYGHIPAHSYYDRDRAEVLIATGELILFSVWIESYNQGRANKTRYSPRAELAGELFEAAFQLDREISEEARTKYRNSARVWSGRWAAGGVLTSGAKPAR